MKRLLLTLIIASFALLCLADPPAHPDWVTFTRTSPTTGLIEWSTQPSLNVDFYYLGLHPTTTQYMPPAYCDPNWNAGSNWVYNFAENPPFVYSKEVLSLNPSLDYYAYVASVETDGWSWSALSSWDSPPRPMYDYPEGQLTPLGVGISLQMTTGNANNGIPGVPTPYLCSHFVLNQANWFTLVGTGPWTMRFSTLSQWIWVVGKGVYAGPGIVDVDITASKDEEIEVQFGDGDNPTLPVELSSFSATLTAQTYVTLAWTTQSETNLLGYRLYRSETGDVSDALMITPTLIPATNTSTTSNYTHDDYEVTQNTTYWYWLESVEFNGGDMHGPTTVMVTGGNPGTPNIPETSSIGNVYPNPVHKGATAILEVSVKEGETASVTIFNTRGQVIRTMLLPEGIHNVNWDGTDSYGKQCSNGLYLYRVSTPSMNQTRKLIIIK